MIKHIFSKKNIKNFKILIFKITNRLNGKSDTYLYSRLGQVDLEGDLLAHEDVRVARLAKKGLQDVQLGTGECGAFSALLPRVDSC